MKIDILHEKFLKIWKHSVAKNLWQAKAMHLVFLSQLLLKKPVMDMYPLAKPEPGLRLQHAGNWETPRLNYFVIAPSGSGKGQGQKCLRNLVRYFNMKYFAQRYGVIDLKTGLWQAYERFMQARNHISKTSKLLVAAPEEEKPDNEKIEDTLIAGGEAGLLAPSPLKPIVVDPVKEFKMSEKDIANFNRDVFDLKQGKYWRFFANDAAMYMPMHVQSSSVTRQFLTGGKEDVPQPDGTTKRIDKPGMLETRSIIAWDEGRNLLFAKTQQEVDLNTTICTALDPEGHISSSARKDIDEFGNQTEFDTQTSIITGTTEVEGLSDMLLGNGLLQRFMVGFYKSTFEQDMELLHAIVDVMGSKPEDTTGLLEDYYQEFTGSSVNRNRVTFSPEAIAVYHEIVATEGEYIKLMFSAGTKSCKVATSTLSRHISVMFQIAAIIAALENKDIATAEHMKKARDFIEKELIEAIVNIVDECMNSEKNISVSHTNMMDAILLDIMRQNYLDGRYVTVFDIFNKIKSSKSYAEKWSKGGIGSTKKFITEWAVRNAEKLRTRTDPNTGEIEYALRNKIASLEKAEQAKMKSTLDAIKKDQNIDETSDWTKSIDITPSPTTQEVVETDDSVLLEASKRLMKKPSG